MIVTRGRDELITAGPTGSRARTSRLPDLAGMGPPVVLFCLFMIVPMVVAVALSFTTWNGLGTPKLAGWSNWTRFFSDPVARTSVAVTAKVVLLSYAVQTPIAMALGLFTAGRERYRTVYATIFVLPLLVLFAVMRRRVMSSLGGVLAR